MCERDIDIYRERTRERAREREREKERERLRVCLSVGLSGFLTSSSATRLYRGRVPKLTSDNLTSCHT